MQLKTVGARIIAPSSGMMSRLESSIIKHFSTFSTTGTLTTFKEGPLGPETRVWLAAIHEIQQYSKEDTVHSLWELTS